MTQKSTLEAAVEYIRIATQGDFTYTTIKSFSILGKKVAIIRREDGSYYAIEASCKHQGADLTKGEIRGNIAICPRHQWQYNLETGECLNHESLPLKKYTVEVRGEDIYISLLPQSG